MSFFSKNVCLPENSIYFKPVINTRTEDFAFGQRFPKPFFIVDSSIESAVRSWDRTALIIG